MRVIHQSSETKEIYREKEEATISLLKLLGQAHAPPVRNGPILIGQIRHDGASLMGSHRVRCSYAFTLLIILISSSQRLLEHVFHHEKD